MSEDLYESLSQWKRVYTRVWWRESAYGLFYNMQMYTWVDVNGRAYIRGISERRVCMQTRVCWSMGYEMSDLFCWCTAICQWVSVWCMMSLNVWSGSSLKIWWKVAYKLCWFESGGPIVKIYETWSTVVLRVGAFNEWIVSPFRWVMVNEIRGS